MDQVVPLEIFGGTPVLISRADGSVMACNRAGARAFGCAWPLPVRVRCWDLGLQDERGDAFCSANCPVRRMLRAGDLPPRHPVVLHPRGGQPVPVELLTFVKQPAQRDSPVMHVILSATGTDRVAKPADPSSRLRQLTKRETEILWLLASGLRTRNVAARLSISPVTVRNHVQHALRKLEVHGRVEAILALLGQQSPGA
jgi:DNA-binding CsgD family transcriptional regulator